MKIYIKVKCFIVTVYNIDKTTFCVVLTKTDESYMNYQKSTIINILRNVVFSIHYINAALTTLSKK